MLSDQGCAQRAEPLGPDRYTDAQTGYAARLSMCRLVRGWCKLSGSRWRRCCQWGRGC